MKVPLLEKRVSNLSQSSIKEEESLSVPSATSQINCERKSDSPSSVKNNKKKSRKKRNKKRSQQSIVNASLELSENSKFDGEQLSENGKSDSHSQEIEIKNDSINDKDIIDESFSESHHSEYHNSGSDTQEIDDISHIEDK